MRWLTGLFVLLIVPSLFAQTSNESRKYPYPTTGNGLLDYCEVMVQALDDPSILTLADDTRQIELLSKLDWCHGYLTAIHRFIDHQQIVLALAAQMGVVLSGPDKAREYLFNSITIACVPDGVTDAQLARVVVKWLRDHPERLHEDDLGLTLDALRDAFPCKSSDSSPTAPPSKQVPGGR